MVPTFLGESVQIELLEAFLQKAFSNIFPPITGFYRVLKGGGCSRGGGNWGTLTEDSVWEDWGTLGNIRKD